MKSLLTLSSLLIATTALAWDAPDFGQPAGPFNRLCTFDGANVTIRTHDGPELTLRNMARQPLDHAGDIVTVRSPAGVVTRNGRAVPLPPMADLVVDCETGSVQGDLALDAIPGLGTAGASDPREDAIDAFGNVGLDIDPGGVRASLGWARGRDIANILGPKDPDAWYLYFDTAIESTDIAYDDYTLELGSSAQLSWWLNPEDPAMYAGIRGSLIGDATGGYVSGVGVGFSNVGNLHWTPSVELRGPAGRFDPHLSGHVAVDAKVSITPYPNFPLKLTIDGDWMFDLGEDFSFSDAVGLARTFLRKNGRDAERVRFADLNVQPRFGANVRQLSLDIAVLSINLGKASVFFEEGGAYFNADPAELGIAQVFATVARAARDKNEKSRRLLQLMTINDVTEMYGYVKRVNDDERKFAVGIIANVGFGGCYVEGAHIKVSDAGIEVSHDDADCVFDDWARDAVAAMCDAVDAEMDACERAADRDACDFECDWDAQVCYSDCRANGRGNAACQIACNIPSFGCLVVDGAEDACDAALTACMAIDDFCEGFEPDPTDAPTDEPAPEPTEEPIDVPAQQNCTSTEPAGWILENLGTLGCGNWTTINNGWRATGAHRSAHAQPTRGSLLVKRTSIPTQQRGATISVDVRGQDDGAAGVVFGYQSATEYNVALIDDARNQVQVWQRRGGQFTLLNAAPHDIDLGAGHTLDVIRNGGGVVVQVDGAVVVGTLETAHIWGRYGVYSFANTRVDFTHLTFEAGCDTNMWGSWQMVNMGTQGCGFWDKQDGTHVAGGMLRINGQRPKYGSMLLRKNKARVGGRISARLKGAGNYAAGLVIDYRVSEGRMHYYFAVLDDHDNTVELWRRSGDTFQRLSRVSQAVNFDAGHTLELARAGSMITVKVGGQTRINVDLSTVLTAFEMPALLVAGRRGLYSYAQSHIAFSNVQLP